MINLHATSKPKERKPGQRPEAPLVKKTEKHMDEIRRGGNFAQVLSDDGKDLNPHIPHFIAAVPWFYKTSEPTLRQHSDPLRAQKQTSRMNETFIKGVPVGDAPQKFVSGACENCGSISHKRKDCLERPRKVGAKFSTRDLKPADYVQPNLSLSYEGKRDRWAGYDPNDYNQVIQEYEIMEKTKQDLKAKKLKEDLQKGESSADIIKIAGLGKKDDSDDDEKYADKSNMPGTKYDLKQRGTVRNLRIREDTAKYLYNLDDNSAFYDPKSRAMRGNPLEDSIRGQNISFKGDLKEAFGVEVESVNQANSFTLNAFEKGIDVHLLTDPTRSELLMRQFTSRKQALDFDHKRDLLNKYGGEEYMQAPPDQADLLQSEEYVEYSRTGKVIKGQERATVRSKYIEDVFTNNHTTVWGSYFEDFQWGYACCKSFIKNSYCTCLIKPKSTHSSSTEVERYPTVGKAVEEANKSNTDEEDAYEEKEVIIPKKKSKFHVLHDAPFPTDKEMENYQMKRKRMGDPMANI